jgi:hypothetical protein
MKSHGVYVLSNPSYKDGLIEIGMTTRSLQSRLDELNRETGVPSPFLCEMFIACDSPLVLESKLHTAFVAQKHGKEFFTAHPSDVQEKAEELLKGQQYMVGIAAKKQRQDKLAVKLMFGVPIISLVLGFIMSVQ